MKRVLIFAFCLVAFGLVAQVIYQPHRRNAFRGPSAPFSPSSVAGLVMWFDASAITSPTNVNGYLVTNWWDRSISAYMAYSPGSAQQPYYTNNVSRLNGHPWLEFDGVNDRMRLATTQLYNQPITTFLVCYHQYSDTAQRYMVASTNITYYYVMGYEVSNNITTYAGAALRGTTTALSNQWFLAEITYTNGGSEILTNGVSYKTGNSGVDLWSGLTLGADHSGGASFHIGGIAEFLYYTNNVSSGDRTSIRSYFTSKYGPYANW